MVRIPLLKIAAEKGHLAVVKALVDHGADVNATGSDNGIEGSAALLKATQTGHREIVELLLEHGANPNTSEEPQGDTYYAPTALDEAKSERIRQLLLRYGADYHMQEGPWGE